MGPCCKRHQAEPELLALVIESYERGKVVPVSPDPVKAILFRNWLIFCATVTA